MTVRKSSPPVDDNLTDLADQVAEEFEEYRDPEGFKQVSIVIDNSRDDQQTLIVHATGDSALEIADEVEEFLHDRNVQTQREHHSSDDIRVLATQ